mmetsp:Transcript_5919/g.12663  ORF Transcript_5919/g.12663 Transcript_5919/m.12663 type:complete len:422 (+) Transcript_5919:172-1437(+)|eukprot:CAMPEP_0201118966 /NCGR_PEP_ID=MMETSP0850-20130426/3150_1 /ASSEMBLY_ACC=CAM_ASM_000622 /TAXON_ID=183588 /ORGANISM="Pseudo-nitzschia fraudulenta, Strain WWA7" /LENGTH=421 /DNA_ID=CAMNT_0047384481 /DNA_START=48 /DNA_END=1313 /DNA_ORIENTATION=+
MGLLKNGIIGLAAALAAAAILGLASANPPFTPPASPTNLIPPWFAFNIGCKLHQFFSALAFATKPPDAYVIDLSVAYWNSEVSFALTKNKILDCVEKETSATCGGVSEILGLQEYVVCRYMEAGKNLRLLNKDATTGEYTLTPHGSLLTDTGDLRDFNLMINGQTRHAWRAAGTELIREGGSSPGRNSGFEISTGGLDFWAHVNEHPELAVEFDGAMKSLSATPTGAFLSDWTPPAPDARFCDIGGGIGSVLGEVLLHYPEMTGIVFDRPEVTERGREHLESIGVGDRAEAIGGNFFEELPEELSGCDVYFFRFIIHDWDDARNTKILENVRAVAGKSLPGKKKTEKKSVVVMDQILDTGAPAFFETAKSLMSLNMVACNPYGARERSVPELNELFEAAGYDGKGRFIPLRTIQSLYEMEL